MHLSARRQASGWAGLLAALLLPAPAAAQLDPPHRPIRFERAALEPFLPQSSVYAIHQDRSGFLWFGTREGLGRWDGYEMRTWKARPFDRNSLPGNLVRRVVEDGEGSLWAQVLPTDRLPALVARLSGPGHRRVESFPYPDATPFIGRDGVAWLAGLDSVYRFDPRRGGFVAAFPRLVRGAKPGGALVDRRGVVWVGSDAGVLERYDPATGEARRIEAAEPWIANAEARPLSSILEDRRGTLWVSGIGIRRLDAARTRIERLPGIPAVLDTIGSSALLQDPDGWLWLATLDGVYRFDPSAARVERHSLRLPGDVHTQNFVVGLLRDRGGAVWAGTVWGLHRFDPWADAFGFTAHDPRDPRTLSAGIVMSVLEDATGALWVGTLGGGLNRIDPRTGAARRFRDLPGDPHSLDYDWVWALADAGGGRVWAGTGTGLVSIDPSSPAPVTRYPLPPPGPRFGRHVLAVHADSAGGVWMGYGGGLLYRTPAGELRPHALPAAAEAQRFLADGPLLWVATSAGLVRFDTRTGTGRSYRHDPRDSRTLSHDVVLSLHRDRAGRLWVGTNSGLNRFLPGSGAFAHYGERDGLPSSVVYAILEDEDGRLWLATNRGLARLDPGAPAGARVRVYDASAGVGNVEFNRNAGFRGRDGTLYFGGDRGLTFFHPSSLRDNPVAPPVVVTAVHRSTNDGVRTAYGPHGGPVVVAPDEYNLTFEFAALAFGNPQRNRHAYRLEGFDARWIEAGAARRASYTNLPPGRYTFRVRGSNEDGLWGQAGVSLPIVVRPWFWQTWWFRALALLALVAGVALSTGLLLRVRHRRQLEAIRYQQALEGERARISRDMHDEVGASLTEIAILSETALRRDPERRAAASDLEKIAGRSRAMLDAIGEIVWALNPAGDRMEHLAAYLREHAAEYLENAGLEATLHFDAVSPAPALTSEFRRNLFLVLKEALANVVQHAGATRARVELAVSGGTLLLRVEDDGRGIAPGAGGPGHHGLANMRRRAAELGGRLAVEPVAGGGTRVSLRVPLPSPAGAGR